MLVACQFTALQSLVIELPPPVSSPAERYCRQIRLDGGRAVEALHDVKLAGRRGGLNSSRRQLRGLVSISPRLASWLAPML
jgi:hypothetical protein